MSKSINYSIVIDSEFESPEQAAIALRQIADLIDRGFTSGVEPEWEMEELEEEFED